MGGSVVWAEVSDEENGERETEAHGQIDETFASRRLRRWLRGMFGGDAEQPSDPPERGPENSEN
jgi:hypothetical protein